MPHQNVLLLMLDVGKQGMEGGQHVHGIPCAAMWADEGIDIGQVSGL